MTDCIGWVSNLMNAVHTQWTAIKGFVTRQFGIQDPITIMPYWGYGTPQQLRLKGRVLQDEGISLQEEDDPFWKNLLNMYRRFETDEVPGAHLEIQVGEQQQRTITNSEGFFDAIVEFPDKLDSDCLWHPITLQLLTDDPEERCWAVGEAIVVGDRAEFGVISDIDDTIMHTAATDLLKMITIAYLGNERTRNPFEGVSEFYHALQQGSTGQAGNPIFYVSSSAWNMYDLFAKFMEFNDVPKGPLFLREIELDLVNLLSFDHRAHKREHIDPIMHQFPDLPFILIGDTGQKDAEIYAQLVEDYPGRIQAVYLRDVTAHDRDRTQQIAAIGEQLQQQGIEFLIFPHTTVVAEHAAAQGWIRPLSGVRDRPQATANR